MEEPRTSAESGRLPVPVPYLLFVLGTSVIALFLLGLSAVGNLQPATRSIISYADLVVCVLFFIDFIVSLARAENKLRYMRTWGWLDLISTIPTLEAFRIGRVGRILRVLRLLRTVRSARIITSFLLQRRAQSALLAATLVTMTLLVFGSIAILQVETGEGANIRGPGDAVWWSITTLTTVGYGDRYPISAEGRVVAAILMVAGVGLFGTLSGFVAAWFLAPAERGQDCQ